MRRFRVILLDLDGVLYDHDGPIPGAAEAVDVLRRRGLSLRFVTNSTARPRAAILEAPLVACRRPTPVAVARSSFRVG